MRAMPERIETPSLLLSRSRAADLDDLYAAVERSHHELRQWMHWAQTMPTRDEQLRVLVAGESAFDAGVDFGYVFREPATGELVGGGGSHARIGADAMALGYWIRSDRHRRGYATVAAAALTDATFDHLEVERVEIHMDCANVASARVPEKLGYRLVRTEAREKLALAHTGQGYVWATTRSTWRSPLATRDVAGRSPEGGESSPTTG